jgi:hypothetical protein
LWLCNMDPVPDHASDVDPDTSLEFAKYLWEEYRYRHDLIWRLLFRLTAVAVLLSIVPFTISDSVRENVGFAVNLLPAAALVLILASWGLLIAEWRRFEPINRDYRETQERVRQELLVPQEAHVPDTHEVPDPKRIWTFLIAPFRRFFEVRDVFKLIVHWYPGVLFLLATVVSLIVWT